MLLRAGHSARPTCRAELGISSLRMLVGDALRHAKYGLDIFLARENTEQRRKQLRIVEIAGFDQAVDIGEGLIRFVLANVNRGNNLTRLYALGSSSTQRCAASIAASRSWP